MKVCDLCQINPPTRSAVVDGEYCESLCDSCLLVNNKVSSGDARWSRTIDTEDHQADLMQPHNADGSVNTDFVKLYPKQAKAVFTSEQITKAMRK